MADWFVGPVMDKIINACFDYLQDQYRWQTGMKEELERLRENYPKIQAVVSAYTQAQITDPALNRWIWQLRDAMDEADDVLDDLEYMKLEEQLIRSKKQQKVRSTMSSLKKIGKRALKMDSNLKRLEKVVKKLDKVSAEVSTFLHLLQYAKQEQQDQQLQLCKHRETGCLPRNDLIGRGKETDYVMQWLRKPTNEDPTHIAGPSLYKNISLLSIVGHGGMGKTALLQHIYEDLKDEFQLKMWVCVSNDFDAKKVIDNMLECFKGPRSESLAAVQESLKAVVQSKRFLLILDDIWEEDTSKWENALCPLVYGGLGSKILLTTRMDSVASAIANVIRKEKEILRINGLEGDECLKLLSIHAFAGVQNLGSHKNLTDIASSMVKKLSGSPLAAKVIGGVLNSNLNERFWTIFSNITDVLNVNPEPGRNNIMPILRLSFTFLPQTLQNCFAFCGIFLQDHIIDKDELVQMWIALGFIQESSIEGETLEDIGGRYFDLLVRKSFFDEFHLEDISIHDIFLVKFKYDKRIYYKMHDLLHDLAKSISSKECLGFGGNNVFSFKIHKNVRHLFVATENLEVLRTVKDVKNLRSLFITNTTSDQGFIEILTEIFEASRKIRLLDICSPHLKKMPKAFENLRHLRYLKLSGGLAKMPRSINSLYHLRFIIYFNWYKRPCCGDFLPGDVSNLSNLRHLNCPENAFFEVPRIGKLRSLEELNEFIVRNKNGYRIGELEHMSELRNLKIHSLENVKDATETCNAKLFEKRKLTDLILNWGNNINVESLQTGHDSQRFSYNSDLDVNVLENLKPYKNLKRLSIVSHKGVSCAKWMYDADLIFNLAYICLNGCSEWETLPPFGQLPHLKYLYLFNMPKVKQLDKAGAAATDECFFPCLTELFLVNCPNLQELCYLPPKLKKMRIQNIGWKAALNCKQGSNNCCGNSKSLPLETLEVFSCPNITSLLQANVGLEALRHLSIIDCPNLISLGGVFTIEAEQWFPHVCSSLRVLTLIGLESLQSLPSSLERLPSLEILIVKEVPQLRQLLHIPASLKNLDLKDLNSLQCLSTSLPAISSLKELYLVSIPLLKTLPQLPPSLNILCIIRLDNLECLPSSLSAISSLQYLWLKSIPLLKTLPDLPSSLATLVLKNCNPELMKRYKKFSGSDWHKIAHIPDVDIVD